MKSILKQELYDHFLTLSVAMCIFICPTLAQMHRTYAKELLEYYVKYAHFLYSQEMIVYNIHRLLHLADDVKCFGALDNCSAFPFENYLQQLKKLVRSGRNPLIQIVKRLQERENFSSDYKKKTRLTLTKAPDNAFIVNKDTCCEVIAVSSDDEENRMLLCRLYEKTEPFFLHPCDSHVIGVHVYVKHA